MSAEYFSKKDLMAYLKISKGTVENLMKQGLPHVKLERRVLFRREDIDAFLESKIVRKGGGPGKETKRNPSPKSKMSIPGK